MKKMNIEDFLSDTPENNQQYLKEIIEDKQNISRLLKECFSEFPEECFSEGRDNLVIVHFRRDNEKIYGVFIKYDFFGTDVNFFNGLPKCTMYDNFDIVLDDSIYDNVCLFRYEIDINNCKRKSSDNGSVYYDGVPMKLSFVKKLANSLKEFRNMFQSVSQFEKITKQHKKEIAELSAKKEEIKQNQEKEIAELSAKKEEIKEEIKQFDRKVSELKDEIKIIKELAEKFGVDIYKKDTTENYDNSKNPENYAELVKHIHNYLGNNGKYYDYNVINSFASGLLTNQIIILSGESGTGKSSLTRVFAEAIGAEQRLVSVQPSWTDNQDLLGFFDFSRGCFAPTPFMDILVEANENPDTIYIVCLDEMNLVRVEYYFSEILSAMESEDKKLHLYSKYLFDENMDELKYKIPEMKNTKNEFIMKFIKNDDFKINISTDEQREALKKIKRLCRYPYEFSIPENIQFVGTLNMDETTKSLSPKVLDRSFVIEVGIADYVSSGGEYEKLNYSFSNYMALQDAKDKKTIDEMLNLYRNIVNNLKNSGIKELEISLSRRNEKNIEQLIRKNGTPDYIFMGKILPSFKGMNITESDFIKISDILNSGMSILNSGMIAGKVAERLSKMYDSDLNEISFWR